MALAVLHLLLLLIAVLPLGANLLFFWGATVYQSRDSRTPAHPLNNPRSGNAKRAAGFPASGCGSHVVGYSKVGLPSSAVSRLRTSSGHGGVGVRVVCFVVCVCFFVVGCFFVVLCLF